MLSTELQELIRHMQWADATVWRAVLQLPDVENDARLRELLHHQHVVQWAYLQIWQEDALDIPELSAFPDLSGIYTWARTFYDEATFFLSELSAEILEREIHFPWAQSLVERWGEARAATFPETVLQIASHTTYHRGQINTRLRELAGEPPLTDFIAWIWMGKPEPDWPRGSTSGWGTVEDHGGQPRKEEEAE